jgi:uncharacterized protein YbaP (TraB family)
MTIRRGALRFVVALAALAAWPAFAQNFLWRVDSLTNHAWLFGTVHAGSPDWYPLPKAVAEAFDDSATLVVEADITNRAEMDRHAPSMSYEAPDTLRNHVPPPDYARFLRLLARFGIPEADAARMKPFAAASLLVLAEWTRQGFLPQLGVDAYFLEQAKQRKKPVVELEGVATQAKLMESVTPAEGIEFFEGTLTALEEGYAAEQIQGMVRAWRIGDPELMLQVARRYDYKVKGAARFEEKFVWSRHDAMVAKISDWLEGAGGTRFIAVGALHLVGPHGLVEMLRAKGYRVQQIFVAPQGEKKNE